MDNSANKPSFTRVADGRSDHLNDNLRDNTFEAKARYGRGGDVYGTRANEKLVVVKGKDFRKEKTKMKNKNFHGSGNDLTYQCNSIRF